MFSTQICVVPQLTLWPVTHSLMKRHYDATHLNPSWSAPSESKCCEDTQLRYSVSTCCYVVTPCAARRTLHQYVQHLATGERHGT